MVRGRRYNSIEIQGARVHNLKDVSVKVPLGSITVVTGLSGSGKSSLAFDTIYAEGQRRYVESLSPYAKQLFGLVEKPDVDMIRGLPPAIAIDQKTAARSPRSTVGTMSEVYDYLRLLFVRVGAPHCPTCQKQLAKTAPAQPAAQSQPRPGRERVQLSCETCEFQTTPPVLGLFSFNSPTGACEACQGLGERLVFDADLLIPNDRLTLEEGAIRPWSRLGNNTQSIQALLRRLREVTGIAPDVAYAQYTAEEQALVMRGTADGRYQGVIPYLEERYASTSSDYVRRELEHYMRTVECDVCRGLRLKASALSVLIHGKNIAELSGMTVDSLNKWLEGVRSGIDETERQVSEPIIRDLTSRLGQLAKVGVGYLTLDRTADSLAGGEAQRIRLATLLGAGLTGVLYVLDEPSVGLHPHDLHRLAQSIEGLRDQGNTVILVEHDQQLIAVADHIIDIGPGAGNKGGKVVGQGSYRTFVEKSRSITAQYLRGEKTIPLPGRRRQAQGHLTVVGAKSFNLKNLTVRIPLQTLTCVTGVSGSGKSTLVQEVLAKALAQHFHRAQAEPGAHERIDGLDRIDKVISVDQSPIGRTPRSNPATYTNVFGPIRDLFAATPLAVERKYSPGHFSFNVRGGRCETCRGDGVMKHEMHFMPDVFVTCETCSGTRYKQEILDIQYNGKTIAEVLAMSISEAAAFFADTPVVASKLDVLVSVGLGYLELGQPATTLSGGEAQRIKLATDLARPSTGKTLYILDEPTTGLHFDDVKQLLDVLHALVDRGNTVVVIEHNLDVVKSSDWMIELGPEAGDAGGYLVAEGTPEQIRQSESSQTGKFF